MPAYRWFPIPAVSEYSIIEVVLAAVRAISFWVAILLVLVYPVALSLPDVLTVEHVLALVVTHAAAVLLGHEHARRT